MGEAEVSVGQILDPSTPPQPELSFFLLSFFIYSEFCIIFCGKKRVLRAESK